MMFGSQIIYRPWLEFYETIANDTMHTSDIIIYYHQQLFNYYVFDMDIVDDVDDVGKKSAYGDIRVELFGDDVLSEVDKVVQIDKQDKRYMKELKDKRTPIERHVELKMQLKYFLPYSYAQTAQDISDRWEALYRELKRGDRHNVTIQIETITAQFLKEMKRDVDLFKELVTIIYGPSLHI